MSLLEEIRGFHPLREVTHCGRAFDVPPFDIYATCTSCGERLKVRSFGGGEIEDIFEAVFEWLDSPGAEEAMMQWRDAKRRSRAMQDE
jgi:hypothetical protein